MRVLAVTSLYPNPYQPHRAPFNLQQFRALAACHSLHVIAPISWTSETTARRTGTRMPVDRREITDGFIVHHPRFAFPPKVLRGLHGAFFRTSIRRCFRETIREFRPDVVLGCWAYPDGWAAMHLAREAGLPVAIKVLGSDLLTIDNHPARKARTVEALAGADAVIAVGRHLAERAVHLGAHPSRVHVVYNGVDTTVFCPGDRARAREQLGLRSPDPLILCIGNLVPVKGIDVLINALASLRHEGARFRCAIVGAGPLRKSLERRIAMLNLDGCTRLVGAKPLKQMPQWYRAADLVVLSSHSEGVPNVLLEAGACGTPFVATRVGGVPEIAGAVGLVPPDDHVALAGAIRKALDGGHPESPAHRTESWNDSAQNLAAVLESIVGAASLPIARAG